MYNSQCLFFQLTSVYLRYAHGELFYHYLVCPHRVSNRRGVRSGVALGRCCILWLPTRSGFHAPPSYSLVTAHQTHTVRLYLVLLILQAPPPRLLSHNLFVPRCVWSDYVVPSPLLFSIWISRPNCFYLHCSCFCQLLWSCECGFFALGMLLIMTKIMNWITYIAIKEANFVLLYTCGLR